MIYLKYSEPTWLAVFFFVFLGLAALVTIWIAGRPKDEEERRLMRIWREGYSDRTNKKSPMETGDGKTSQL